MSKTIKLNFYSPRWGHEDQYVFEFDQTDLNVSFDKKQAMATKNNNGIITWKGHNYKNGNPLLNILHNDKIYPPDIFIEGIIYAWESWTIGDITDQQLESELTILTNWVNICSKNKPNSPYWLTCF